MRNSENTPPFVHYIYTAKLSVSFALYVDILDRYHLLQQGSVRERSKRVSVHGIHSAIEACSVFCWRDKTDGRTVL